MLIPQQSSTTPVRPAESINTKKEGINHAEQYPQHKPAL
jgi:hypothetical protein